MKPSKPAQAEHQESTDQPEQTPEQTLEQTKERPRFEKPKLQPEPKPEQCQHMRFLDCDKPIKRLVCECYRCKQGLILQLHSNGEIQQLEPPCPNCGKTAIRLEATEVLSVTPIPSPWEGSETI